MKKNLRDSVTFVMTSCNRFDLLGSTLQSFLDYNTYPIEQYIFIEDTLEDSFFRKNNQKILRSL